jgi:hypothetical protein
MGFLCGEVVERELSDASKVMGPCSPEGGHAGPRQGCEGVSSVSGTGTWTSFDEPDSGHGVDDP